ncbi:LytTR family transcriptional regulator DNA-binding domain-containing protein [Fibrella forsythiae]|uniref:LytTR family transcriptional regulator n=1 Tax=Fibrella forsythiae TaxID=2817061 RepID=A0ABS3JNJ6_9BACT|nr:LytTR family transcriptional regulator [Fibrella forsythiae]
MIYFPGYSPLKRPELIIRLEGDGNYTNIYSLQQSRPLLVSQTLLHHQRQLPSFLRVSKSSLVNPAHVVRIVKKGRVVHLRLQDDAMVLVSRRRVSETVAALDKLCKLTEMLPE